MRITNKGELTMHTEKMRGESMTNIKGKQARGHTPGPWEIKTRPDGLGGKDKLVYAKGLPVCDCFQGVTNEETEQANATLIAAAPELLEAAQKAFTFIEDRFPGEDYGWRLKKAISKAQGVA